MSGEDTIQNARVYAEELGALGRGVPLWYPEPSVSGEVQIGDVGYLYNGGFHRMFNITVPASHPWNIRGVPDGFAPLSIDSRWLTDVREDDLPEGLLQSESIKTTQAQAAVEGSAGWPGSVGFSLSFQLQSHQGAMLLLKDSATRKVLIAHKAFESYMRQHLKSWHEFSENVMQLNYVEEDLLLVNGWTKTKAWHLAAFYGRSKLRAGSVEGRVATVAGANITISVGKNSPIVVEQRYGPPVLTSTASSDPDSSGNQSIFLIAYRAKRRKIPWRPFKIVAAADYDELPDPHNDNTPPDTAVSAGEVGDENPRGSQSGSFSFAGPCDIVLDYILENSNAEIAITSESTVDEMFGGEPWPNDIPKYLAQNRPDTEVEDGVGTISLPAIVRKARLRETADAQAATQNQPPPDPTGRSGERQQEPLSLVETGQLTLHSGSTHSKTIPWPHIVLKDPTQKFRTATCMSISQKEFLVAGGTDDGCIAVWNARTANMEMKGEAHDDPIYAVAISPDATKVASGSASGITIIWDIDESMQQRVLAGHEADVCAVAWSPNGKLLVTGSVDTTARLWNVSPDVDHAESEEPLHVLEGHESALLVAGFSPDSSRVLTCAEEVGRVWDASTGTLLHSLIGHEGGIWCMQFSQDCARIVTGSEDNTARIWDAGSGAELVIIRDHVDPVWSVAFSPDGRDVVSASYDGSVAICDSFSGERKHLLEQGRSPVNSVVYATRGDLVASGSSDGRVKVWDALNGALVAEFACHEDKVKAVAFAADDRNVVSLSDDGSMRVCNVQDMVKFL